MERSDTSGARGRRWRVGSGALKCAAGLLLASLAAGPAAAQGDVLRVTLDDRLALERRAAGDLWRYEERRGPGGLVIVPAHPRARALWEGTGPIRRLPPPGIPARPPALRIDLRSAAPALEVVLQITHSSPHLRPMLGRRSDIGCDAFAPRFWLENAGWAPVEGATLTLRFHDGEAATEARTLDLPGFDQRLQVDLGAMLATLGLDAAALAACGPEAESAACAAALSELSLAPVVRTREVPGRWGSGPDLLVHYLTGSGSLDYRWTGAEGHAQTAAQPIGVTVTLGVSPAQLGEADQITPMLPRPEAEPAPPPPAAGRAPMAPDLVPVRLRDAGQRYAVALPLRGNPRTLARALLAELAVPRSSTHRLAAQARLEDGRALTSGPVTAHLVIPRPLPPLAARSDCTLPRGITLPPTLTDPLPHPDDLRASPAGDRP